MLGPVIRLEVSVTTGNKFDFRNILDKFERILNLEFFLDFFQSHFTVIFERFGGKIQHLFIVISQLILDVPICLIWTFIEIGGEASLHSHSRNSPLSLHESLIESRSECFYLRAFGHRVRNHKNN